MLYSKISLVVAFILGATLLFILSCKEKQVVTETPTTAWEKPRVPDWHKNATIYEVNLRHFTKENTFKSFEAHIPRLKDMGIDILWFMPIQPISVKKRKGEFPALGGARPSDYMDTITGQMLVSKLLMQSQTGVFA